MSFELPDKIKNLKPYDPIEGDFNIRLDSNECFEEPYFGEIDEEFQKNILSCINRYPDPYARKLVNSFCNFWNKYYNNLSIKESNVTAGNGLDEIISLIFSLFLEKNEKVAALESDFSMYYFYPHIWELDLKIISKNADFSINTDNIISYINSEKIKLLIFSNPCNPTSLGLSRSEVINIIENCPKTLIIVDEAYMDFWDIAESVMGEVSNYENLVVLKTCSKAFAGAGLRLGFAVANQKITYAIKAGKSPYNVNSVSQTLGKMLFENIDFDFRIKKIKKYVEEIYNRFIVKKYSFVEKIFPPKTNFLYIKSINSETTNNIFEFFKSKSIIIRIHNKEYLRITAGSVEENKELFSAIDDFEFARKLSQKHEIILASGSPRRKEILNIAGYEFKTLKLETDEYFSEDVPPEIAIINIAKEKLDAVEDKKDIVIAADTAVILDKKFFGKPNSLEEARVMLKKLSGKKHEVITAVAYSVDGKSNAFYETTSVYFKDLSGEQIEEYLNTNEYVDKAGAYGIQVEGAKLISRIEGDYYNVMGLPIDILTQHLKTIFARDYEKG